MRLFYRHVDQAERWTSAEANTQNGRSVGSIPAEYTQTDFPLEYYFELKNAKGVASLYPGFNPTYSNQPYFAVSKRQA